MSWFLRLENFILVVARGFFLVIVCSAFIVAIGGLIWIAFEYARPIQTDIRELLTAPSYNEIRTNLLPVNVPTDDDKSEDIDVDAVPQTDVLKHAEDIEEVLEILDKQYNQMGRTEPKFSQQFPPHTYQRLWLSEIEENAREDQEILQSYFVDVKSFATDISQDELLTRIGDTANRTRLIRDAMDHFHSTWIDSLNSALIQAASAYTARQIERNSNVLQLAFILGASFIAILGITILVVLLRVEFHLRRLNVAVETKDTPINV